MKPGTFLQPAKGNSSSSLPEIFCEENMCKIDNILKLFNKKPSKFKYTSDFLTSKSVAIQDWLNSEVEFSFFYFQDRG